MKKIRRAIISVDKTGIVEFTGELNASGVEIISTGGTADDNEGRCDRDTHTVHKVFRDARREAQTLHPKIHGGILGIRSNPAHAKEMDTNGILPIDMVVVNLYAFEETIAKGCAFEDAVENIDIGGPTMMAAARTKRWRR
jgi:phosphoribosylaminoimidazolecarboxamide formyltransferase/IMP cyclohydrolase